MFHCLGLELMLHFHAERRVMEKDGGGCYATQTNQSPSVGKLQNVHQEELGFEAQQNGLTQQRDTMQHPQSSVPDDYQSALQSASNSKLSKVDSVDSGVVRSYSSSQLSHLEDAVELASPIEESIPTPARADTGSGSTQVSSTSTDASHSETLMMKMDGDDCHPMQTKQSLSEFVTSLEKKQKQLEQLTDQFKNLKLKARELLNSLLEFEVSLERVGKELTDQVGYFESQVMLQREVSFLKGSSVETSESTHNQSSCTSPCLDSPENVIPLTPDMSSVDTQSQPYTRTSANNRLYSDSMMTRDRRFEMKRKQLRTVKPRPLSEWNQAILELSGGAQENLSSSQLVELSAKTTDSSRLKSIEEELMSRVKHNQPVYISQTNWKLLLPHLVSVGLSDRATNDYLLNETRTDHDKGMYFYLKILPSKGPDAYTRFHRCLCDEKEHLGHQSLLEIFDNYQTHYTT